MKLCIPCRSGHGLDAEVEAHFGRAPWFHFVDTVTGVVISESNPSCHSNPGVCHHVSLLAGHGVDAVAGGGIGRRAAEGLMAAGIEVLVTDGQTVGEVLDEVRGGRARPRALAETCAGHSHDHRHGEGCGSEPRS